MVRQEKVCTEEGIKEVRIFTAQVQPPGQHCVPNSHSIIDATRGAQAHEAKDASADQQLHVAQKMDQPQLPSSF
jgi:hypothetical protein